MTAKIIPNSFQSPNAYVDSMMELLTGEEYKCLSFAARHILGWQDKISKRRGVISLSMFESGYTDGAGNVYGGTGLTRSAILTALDALTIHKLLLKIGDPTTDGQEWELGDNPDVSGLVQRREQKRETAKLRTAQALAARQAKRSGGTSDVPVRGTNQSQYVARTAAGTSDVPNQNHIKTNQNQRDEDASRSNIFTLYEAAFGLILPSVVEQLKDTEQEFPADWIVDAFALTQARRGRSFNYTRKILDNWLKHGRDDQGSTPAAAAPAAALVGDDLLELEG